MAGKPPLKLGEGDPAPDFTAPVGGGGTVTLSALRGRPVVLFFYPKDSTPGCTREACAFRDLHQRFESSGAVVLGVHVGSGRAALAVTQQHNQNNQKGKSTWQLQ